jgi:hypothetical protein
MNDPDNPEWTARDFVAARPASEILPSKIAEQLSREHDREQEEFAVAVAVRNAGPGLRSGRFGSLTLRSAA